MEKKKVYFLVPTNFGCYVEVTLQEYMYCLKSARINNLDYSIDVDKKHSMIFVTLYPIIRRIINNSLTFV